MPFCRRYSSGVNCKFSLCAVFKHYQTLVSSIPLVWKRDRVQNIYFFDYPFKTEGVTVVHQYQAKRVQVQLFMATIYLSASLIVSHGLISSSVMCLSLRPISRAFISYPSHTAKPIQTYHQSLKNWTVQGNVVFCSV